MSAPQTDTPPDFDAISFALEAGARARQILALGVGADLDRRRAQIWKLAENELRSGNLDGNRAFMHIACSNALRRYSEELTTDIEKAQTAADKLRDASEPNDGDNEPRQGD